MGRNTEKILAALAKMNEMIRKGKGAVNTRYPFRHIQVV